MEQTIIEMTQRSLAWERQVRAAMMRQFKAIEDMCFREDLTPQERLDEIVGILAVGVDPEE